MALALPFVRPVAITGTHETLKGGFTKNPPPAPAAPPVQKPVVGFHGAVSEFKRRLIEATLAQSGGNRTRAAKALGLQRTYLLRLMREFQIHFPAAQAPPRRATPPTTTRPPQIGWR